MTSVRLPSPASAELDRWMSRVSEGDRAAFGPLFRALWPVVRAYCERLVPPADADDAAQASLEKLFAQASDYERTRPVVAWALTIATWECRTLRKRALRRGAAPLDDGLPSVAPTPEEAALRTELEQAARSALERLSPADRELILVAFEESPRERGALGATLRKRKERALAKLRALFGRPHDG
jgi:RNA polymerase sigma factor (sigma-70 family)